MSGYARLLTALLVCNVLVRAFTNGFGVLPKIFNVVDIALVGVLFFLSLVSRTNAPFPDWAASFPKRLALFSIVLVLGCVLNSDYIFLPATLSQIVMLVEPLLLFVAVVRLPLTSQ